MDIKEAAQFAKDDLEWVDALVRRLLPELAESVWGRNAPLRRKWTLQRKATTWRVRNAARREDFLVAVDLHARRFQVDCHDGPVFSTGLSEAELRGALAVAQHRGPGGIAK